MKTTLEIIAMLDAQNEIKTGPKPKKIRCIESGEIFESRKELSDIIGVHINYLTPALTKGLKCKGVHFEYVK